MRLRLESVQVDWNDSELVISPHSWGQVLKDAPPNNLSVQLVVVL